MKKQPKLISAGLLSFMLLLVSSLQGQNINPDLFGNLTHFMPRIDLSVRQFSGDFTEWKNEYNEADPTIVAFRAITNRNSLGPSRWQVLMDPTNSSTIVAEGDAGTLHVNQYLGFTIDFRTIVGTNNQRPLTYWVRLLGYQNVRTEQEPPPPVSSRFVRINFVGSGPTTHFTFEGLHPEFAYSMPVGVRLQTLTATGDDDIEPYLLVAIVYADGTTIVPELDVSAKKIRFNNSQVRIAGGSETHGNILGDDDMDSDETVQIPTQTGYFETFIRPIGLQFADQYGLPESQKKMLRQNTQVAIVVIGMEEDAIPSTEATNEVNTEFITALQEELDKLVRGVEIDAGNLQFPSLTAAVLQIKDNLRTRLESFAKAKTIAELESYLAIPAAPMLATFGAANADDYIGTGVQVITYQDILAAGETGIAFKLDVSDNPDEDVAYSIEGKIYVRK